MLVRILPVVMPDEEFINELFWGGDQIRSKGISLIESLNLLLFKPSFTIKQSSKTDTSKLNIDFMWTPGI